MYSCQGLRPIPSSTDLHSRERREGREAVVQRALSSLMFGHEPKGWNFTDTPTDRGQHFIELLDAAAFGTPHPEPARLVDEFELPGRHVEERAGSPDFAVLWSDRMLLVELKAERSSHTPGQCERYLDLARHHYPHCQVDLIYLTPSMPAKDLRALPDGSRYAHLAWPVVLPHIVAAWSGSDHPAERALTALLAEYLPALDQPRTQRKPGPTSATVTSATGTEPDPAPTPAWDWAPVADSVLHVAARVQGDRCQRGVDVPTENLDALDAVRIQVRDLLRTGPVLEGIRITHVQPWIWRAATSTGKHLTNTGRDTGYEMRLSYYTAPFADIA
ncbi:hypothetical protein ACFPH6_14665 [Streptomyces xiangluensis]|uniref:PD-(D/E)XK nuclease superfamily protein n=1 Tax=Streptomyces xiangluensis TaxID=2665720 RepID=A0ABV8YMG1_9ACTN